MKPYYEHAGITIYHGDCLEVLPTLPRVDLVLTDPPYGIDGGRGSTNVRRAKGVYASAFDDNRAYIQSLVVPVIQQLIAQCSCVVVTPGNKNFDLYPQAQSFGAFYQPASIGLQTFGNADAQPILYYGKNLLKRNMGVPCSYVLTESPDTKEHPCAKPFRMWRRLLSNLATAPCVVLDPFMGSGVTLRAAKDLGMRAIGIELDERYCEIAANRLQQEVMELV